MTFDRSILYMTARSPFARRVRIALLEHGVAFEERLVDVFDPSPEFRGVSPLARVPVLELRDGTRLVDSHLILQALFETVGDSPFMPRAERGIVYSWMGIAAGLCDKIVEYHLEMLRPAAQRDPVVLSETEATVHAVLGRLEDLLARQGSILPNAMTQADLDLGVALAYCSFRYSPAWKGEYPRATDFLARMEMRQSFQNTRPPG